MTVSTDAFEATADYARLLDAEDPLRSFREQFHIPRGPSGAPVVYLAGNSLGLQPRKAKEFVDQELRDWAEFGVEGHHRAKNPWVPYHELLTAQTARLVGALPIEVAVMNTLTVNLHLMLVSFYRPAGERRKILIEKGAFPSDRYAAVSQLRFHGLDPASDLIEAAPRPGESTLREEDLLALIDREGPRLALVLLGNVNYLTGQAFDMEGITRLARKHGARVGFDLAHGAGNLRLALHDIGADFAVWCSYKYLNSGPGSLAGCFVHERHAKDLSLPRFAGWWGHDKAARFRMEPDFDPIPGAEGWQLSNPPILQMAALRASMELFDAAGMEALRKKADRLTAYLDFLLRRDPPGPYELITPARRGCQLSLRVREAREPLLARLKAEGVLCDFREPDILRAAPVPLYNTFSDVYAFARALRGDR